MVDDMMICGARDMEVRKEVRNQRETLASSRACRPTTCSSLSVTLTERSPLPGGVLLPARKIERRPGSWEKNGKLSLRVRNLDSSACTTPGIVRSIYAQRVDQFRSPPQTRPAACLRTFAAPSQQSNPMWKESDVCNFTDSGQ